MSYYPWRNAHLKIHLLISVSKKTGISRRQVKSNYYIYFSYKSTTIDITHWADGLKGTFQMSIMCFI